MRTEFRGKVKQKVWLKPFCTDQSDTFRLGQQAKKAFRHDCRADGEAVDVAAADVLDEAQELGDPPLPDSDDNRQE